MSKRRYKRICNIGKAISFGEKIDAQNEQEVKLEQKQTRAGNILFSPFTSSPYPVDEIRPHSEKSVLVVILELVTRNGDYRKSCQPSSYFNAVDISIGALYTLFVCEIRSDFFSCSHSYCFFYNDIQIIFYWVESKVFNTGNVVCFYSIENESIYI
jgi:hypothetical protein